MSEPKRKASDLIACAWIGSRLRTAHLLVQECIADAETAGLPQHVVAHFSAELARLDKQVYQNLVAMGAEVDDGLGVGV